MERIPVARPSIGTNERAYVLDAVDTGWISSVGPYISKFEAAFAEQVGAKHAIATVNGTVALHLALMGKNLQPGDEVIIPTVTFIATANAVTYCGAVPVVVDVELPNLNISAQAIEAAITPRTVGIIPVHLFGHPADMDAVNEIAARHGLWVIEDAAESHGALWNGKQAGTLADAAMFSFFGNKIIATGEGGMVTTNDDEMAAHMRLLRGQGMDPGRRYWFIEVGYNYRMTNLQAALGLAQLERLPEFQAQRTVIADTYNSVLSAAGDRLLLPHTDSRASHAHWMYSVYLTEGGEADRDRVMRELDALGIETRPVFYPMHMLPPYRNSNSYPIADTWAVRGISLPTFHDLTVAQVERVAESLLSVLG
jgi:perosamine synthetase